MRTLSGAPRLLGVGLWMMATAFSTLTRADEPHPVFVLEWGSYGGGDGQFARPYSVAVSTFGTVYVADTDNKVIKSFSSSGDFLRKWESRGPGEIVSGTPGGVAVGPEGNVYVVDSYGIVKFTADGNPQLRWGNQQGSGDGQGAFLNAATDEVGNIYVTDVMNARVQAFNAQGGFLIKWGGPGNSDGHFLSPFGIAVSIDARVHVGDAGSALIQEFSATGQFVRRWNPSAGGVAGVAVDQAGNIYVVDQGLDRIIKFTNGGSLVWSLGETGSGPGQFRSPKGVALDQQGNVYVADSGNHRIQKFAPSGSTPADRTTWGRIKALYR